MRPAVEHPDVVILGAGFAGALLAITLKQQGLNPVLLEKHQHPRFAIGESSTPLANLLLERIARRHGLSWLEPFCNYGSWKERHPTVTCGLKRGFSFFRHAEGQAFSPSPGHDNELFVAANPDSEHGDTHWLRSDVDAYLVARATEAGVNYRDRCDITAIERDDGWRIRCTANGKERAYAAPFLVDAAGSGAVLPEVLGIARDEAVATRTRAIYGHFEGVTPVRRILDGLGASCGDYPFDPDVSALHHVIDGGWMWVLRFDNGVSVDREWADVIGRYPTIAFQFEQARAIRPLVRTGRMQRRLASAAGAGGKNGEGWAILPFGAAFVDPWLSPGMAHTLFSVERLVELLCAHDAGERAERLEEYERLLFLEADLVDEITSTCMACFDDFEAMSAVSMLYFAAAIHLEELIRAGKRDEHLGFLLAADPRYRGLVRTICTRARYPNSRHDLTATVRDGIAEYNTAGLCDPTRRNMYPYLPAGK